MLASEKRFWGSNDSQTIQNAINEAAKTGENYVTVPRYNARSNSFVWEISEAILLPSDITVVLDSAHLRLADGVFDNIFRNANCGTDLGKTLEGEQHDIRIIGVGNALLDGGNSNGMCEQLCRDNPGKYPSMYVNLLIQMHNVRDFAVRGLNVRESRWWSFAFMYCRYGIISDCNFKMYATVENQDGIDLRVGCEYITIENITGITGDDTIALTALPCGGRESEYRVEGKSVDIHDINIRNITSASHGCSIIRFLIGDGAKEYNINVDNVKDTGEATSSSGILLGAGRQFWRQKAPAMGDMQNIVIRNLSTCAQTAIYITNPLRDVFIENVATYGEGEVGPWFGKTFEAENVRLKNISFRADSDTADTVLLFESEKSPDMDELSIENVVADTAKYVIRGFCHENISVKCKNYSSYFTEEKPKLASVYGKYHRCFYGKVIENRPKNSRF